MSALTQIFSFLFVYLRLITAFIFGGEVYLSSFPENQYAIAKSIFNSFGLQSLIIFPGKPILMLVIGIFAVGSIIGLAKRLIR